MTGNREITGLASAINWSAATADSAERAAETISATVAHLANGGVTGDALASLGRARERFAEAAEALRAAETSLAQQLPIADAYNATGGNAGSKAFITANDTSGRQPDQAGDAAGPEDAVEQAVRDAYGTLVVRGADEGQKVRWVRLVDLRAELEDAAWRREQQPYDRADVDAALQRLAGQPGIHVQGEANQQSLTDEDWEAGVRFGGSTRHIFAIDHIPLRLCIMCGWSTDNPNDTPCDCYTPDHEDAR